MSLYFKDGRAKVELALAKGKKEYDKRQTLRERQDKREAAGLSLTWDKIVGSTGRSVSIEHFGASADYKTLFTKFGITTDAAVAAAKESLAAQ